MEEWKKLNSIIDTEAWLKLGGMAAVTIFGTYMALNHRRYEDERREERKEERIPNKKVKVNLKPVMDTCQAKNFKIPRRGTPKQRMEEITKLKINQHNKVVKAVCESALEHGGRDMLLDIVNRSEGICGFDVHFNERNSR